MVAGKTGQAGFLGRCNMEGKIGDGQNPSRCGQPDRQITTVTMLLKVSEDKGSRSLAFLSSFSHDPDSGLAGVLRLAGLHLWREKRVLISHSALSA